MDSTFEKTELLFQSERNPRQKARAGFPERLELFQIPRERFALPAASRRKPGPIGDPKGAYAEPIFIPYVPEVTALMRIKRIGGIILASFTVLAWIADFLTRHAR